MIDLPTQKDMVSPHHRRAVWALIAASVVFIGVIVTYFVAPIPEIQNALNPQEARVNVPNPNVQLSPEQVVSQKKLMEVKNTTVKLTPAQVEQQKKLMGQ